MDILIIKNKTENNMENNKNDAGWKDEKDEKDEKEAAAAAPSQDAEMKEEDNAPSSEATPTPAAPPPPPPEPVKMEKRKKIIHKTIDLPITTMAVGTLSYDRLQDAIGFERTMCKQDRTETERLTAKNCVEEYVYDIRSRINDDLIDYISEDSFLL